MYKCLENLDVQYLADNVANSVEAQQACNVQHRKTNPKTNDPTSPSLFIQERPQAGVHKKA